MLKKLLDYISNRNLEKPPSRMELKAQLTIKNSTEIALMREVGRLTAKVLQAVATIIKPGITTADIDQFCEKYIVEILKAKPGSKGQYDYPFTINTSVNAVVCHGMPSSSEVLRKGDIINVDVTVIKNGFYGDSSKMFCVGPISNAAKKLIKVTQECLYLGILAVKPKATLGDIGHAIQSHAKKNRYSVVEEYCGHGIGKKMHEEPEILHYGEPGTGLQLQPGMTFTIEPMINQGSRHVTLLDDGWTVMTKDSKLSAQCEHTILVTQRGFEILTIRDEERAEFSMFAEQQLSA